MKIVHWDEMFHPAFGYQINLLAKFQKLQGNNVVVLTSSNIENHPTFKTFANNINIQEADRKYKEETGVEIKRLPIFGVISGRVIYKPGFVKAIKDEHPDILFCHTNDTLSSIQLVYMYQKIKCPIIFDNHMLDMASVNKLSRIFQMYFRLFVAPKYKKNRWIVFRTQDDDYVNRRLGIPKEQTPFLSFGSDTELFKEDESSRIRTRNELGISEDSFVVIYAGKLTEGKGATILSGALKEKFLTEKKVTVLVIGNTQNSKLEREFTMSDNDIIRLPTQNYIDLPKYYQCADLALFPKQVSLSFFDVQATGLPVIASSNNISDERLSHGNGFTYRLGNIADFRLKMEMCINMNSLSYRKMRDMSRAYIKKNFDYKDIARECTKIMESEIELHKNKK